MEGFLGKSISFTGTLEGGLMKGSIGFGPRGSGIFMVSRAGRGSPAG